MSSVVASLSNGDSPRNEDSPRKEDSVALEQEVNVARFRVKVWERYVQHSYEEVAIHDYDSTTRHTTDLNESDDPWTNDLLLYVVKLEFAKGQLYKARLGAELISMWGFEKFLEFEKRHFLKESFLHLKKSIKLEQKWEREMKEEEWRDARIDNWDNLKSMLAKTVKPSEIR